MLFIKDMFHNEGVSEVPSLRMTYTQSRPSLPTCSGMFRNQGVSEVPSFSETKTGSTEYIFSNQTPSRSYQPNGFQRSVLTKLDTLIEKHDETLSILRVLLSATRGVNENEMLEDILPSPLDSIEELQELCSRLDDEEFRKKMLQFLVALCGHNCALSIRRIMSKLGTNKLWSGYSMKGRKSKLAFKELAVCKIIVKACVRVHKGSSELNVEDQIAEYLKYAPSKAGGSRFKDRKNGSNEAQEYFYMCEIN